MRKVLGLKCTDENGHSCFAVGRFERKYAVGKTYKSRKEFPFWIVDTSLRRQAFYWHLKELRIDTSFARVFLVTFNADKVQPLRFLTIYDMKSYRPVLLAGADIKRELGPCRVTFLKELALDETLSTVLARESEAYGLPFYQQPA